MDHKIRRDVDCKQLLATKTCANRKRSLQVQDALRSVPEVAPLVFPSFDVYLTVANSAFWVRVLMLRADMELVSSAAPKLMG